MICIPANLPEHPVTRQIRAALDLPNTGESRAVIAWGLVKVWEWVRSHPNGLSGIRGITRKDVDETAGITGFADAMSECGLLLFADTIAMFPMVDRFTCLCTESRGGFSKELPPGHSTDRFAARRSDWHAPCYLSPPSEKTPNRNKENSSSSSSISKKMVNAPSAQEFPVFAALRAVGVDADAAADDAKKLRGVHPSEVLLQYDRIRSDKRVRNPSGLLRTKIAGGWHFEPPSIAEAVSFMRRRSSSRIEIAHLSDGIYVGRRLFAAPAGFREAKHWRRLVFNEEGWIDWRHVQ